MASPPSDGIRRSWTLTLWVHPGGFALIPGAHKAVLGPGAFPGPGDSYTFARHGVGPRPGSSPSADAVEHYLSHHLVIAR